MKILYHTPSGTTVPWNRAADDNEPPVGLSAEYQVYSLIEQARPSDSSTHYASRLPDAIDHSSKTVTRGWELVEREVEPIVVTMRSFRLAMGRSRYVGLMSLVGSITDVDEKFEAQTFIEYSITVARNHPMVLAYAAKLEKSNEEVDAIFAEARRLDLTV